MMLFCGLDPDFLDEATGRAYRKGYGAGVAAERERIASFIEEWVKGMDEGWSRKLVAAIREGE